MTEETHNPIALLAMLEALPVEPAPVARLLDAGHTQKRRRRRIATAGAAAVTALVIGGFAAVTNPWGQHAATPPTGGAGPSHTEQRASGGHGGGGLVPQAGRGAPLDLLGPDRAGDTVDLIALRGRVVFIVAFGSWCAPCESNVATLTELRTHVSEDDLAIVGLDEGEPGPEQATTLRAKWGIDFPVLDDASGSILASLPNDVRGLPTITALDRTGRFAAELVGPTSLDDLMTTFDELEHELGGPQTPAAADVVTAEAVVAAEVPVLGAELTSATLTVSAGTLAHPNTGNRECHSGRLLHLDLIGNFTKVVTSGVPPNIGRPSEAGSADDPASGEVHRVLIVADAASGQPCDISVQTGQAAPDAQAQVLSLP